MKFIWFPPLMIFITMQMLVSIFYLITYSQLPENVQNFIDRNLWIFYVYLIPFLIWASIGKTDEETKKDLEKYHKQQEENKAILKKYEEMKDLK